MTRDDEANFARRMSELRAELGISQSELARKMVERGFDTYSQMTVSRTEKGERPIRLGEARVIAEILGSRVDSMTRGTDREEYIALLAEIKRGLIKAILDTGQALWDYRSALEAMGDSWRSDLADDEEVRAAKDDVYTYFLHPRAVALWAAEVANDPMRDAPESLDWSDLTRMKELQSITNLIGELRREAEQGDTSSTPSSVDSGAEVPR